MTGLDQMEIIWIVIMVIGVLVEVIVSGSLISIWFSFGALFAIVAHNIYANTVLEIVVFLVLSLLMLLAFKPFVVRYLQKDSQPTNLDRYYGHPFRLQKAITAEDPGEIIIEGVTWRVISADNTECRINTLVKIVGIDGNKYVVEKCEE